MNYGGSTPTRPSTAQYNYSFNGWSLTIDGEGDPDAQKHVVEDRNLYAVFTAAIYVPWEYGQKPGAPWGAANATVHYVDEGWQAEFFPEQGAN